MTTTDPTSEAPLRTHVFTTPLREFGSEGKHWSPCASTLVTGKTDAVLTDTGHIKSEVSALGDMIEQSGKQLTTIYITHGHLDHFLGIGQLMKRFPGAQPVASAAVVADIKSSVAAEVQVFGTCEVRCASLPVSPSRSATVTHTPARARRRASPRRCPVRRR